MPKASLQSLHALLACLLKKLAEKGWPLGGNVKDEGPVVQLERLVNAVLAGERSGLAPLPDWLIEVFKDDAHASVKRSFRDLIASYLNYFETCCDILDSMTLWLDYDACIAAGQDGIFDHFMSRQHDLQGNLFYKLLSQQDYVQKKDNPLIRRTGKCEDLSLRQRLQFLGTFTCVNFATNEIRDFVLQRLRARYKTDVIPGAFLDFFDSLLAKDYFTHAIVVSGRSTLFFSIEDHLISLRRTDAGLDRLNALERGSVEDAVEYCRDCFVQGTSTHSPASHFRFDKSDQQDFINTLALIFWLKKLREARLSQERLQTCKRTVLETAGLESNGPQEMDYHSGLLLGKIAPGASLGVMLMNPRNPQHSALSCRLVAQRDLFLLLAFKEKEAVQAQMALNDPFTLRFHIKAWNQEPKYYACQCTIENIHPAGKHQTILVAQPKSIVVPMERRYPRVAPDVLPLLGEVDCWLGVRYMPKNSEELATLERPWPVWPGPKDSIIKALLMNISAGGACIEVRCKDTWTSFLTAHHDFGLFRFVSTCANDARSTETLLKYQFRSMNQQGEKYHAGMLFLEEAEQTASGRIRWRNIAETGCNELSRHVFISLLKQR